MLQVDEILQLNNQKIKAVVNIVGLAEDQKLACHASYTEEEFLLVINVAKRNQEFLLKYNMKVRDLEKMIRKLKISRRYAHAKFCINNERV